MGHYYRLVNWKNTLKIWVDIDNAPHVLVLSPIIRRLRSLGHEVWISARDFGQVVPLLKLHGLSAEIIGQHAGKSKYRKILFLFSRSVRLFFYAFNRHFDLALSHGSRATFAPCRLLRIPLVLMQDYEYTAFPPFICRWASLWLLPKVVTNEILKLRGYNINKRLEYPGLKEELYIYADRPNSGILTELGISESKVIILLRPPATMAHYHIHASEELFFLSLDYLAACPNVHIILLPRTPGQAKDLEYYIQSKMIPNISIPDKVYRGPELILSVDIVMGGGGTMNREAACLGVPVYSMFAGKLGAVDRHLIQTRKMKMVTGLQDLAMIPLRKKPNPTAVNGTQVTEKLIDFIVNALLAVGRKYGAES